MARSDEAAQPIGSTEPAGSSMMVWIGAMVGLSVLAAGVGVLLGQHLAETVRKELQNGEQSGALAGSKYTGDIALRELPPIIANLAEPPDSWVRLKVAIVFDAKTLSKPDIVAAQIAEDILGFMRTMSLAQIAGASGLQHLREDLNERASVRSEGEVRELIIEALVMQ